jgi:glycolate oxidase
MRDSRDPASLKQALRRLARTLAPGELRWDAPVLDAHAGDKWYARRRPDAVAFPRSARSVSTVLRWAHRHGVPVTARGAGHGYVGGAVPWRGGVVLSLDRMTRIREISERDFVAVVDPGVRTQALQEAVEKVGLFYPPDPASRSECSIGGNIATNAGGPRCLKYGVTRDYVLGLEVALADGTLVRLGSRTHKNKTGFELARLFVGSEGLLGVVTQATLKLLPLPPTRACAVAGFSSMRQAARAIRGVFAAGLLPCALEVADAFTLRAAHRRTGKELLRGCQALLIIELDGQPAAVRSDLRELEKVLDAHRPRTRARGMGATQVERVWALRREFSYGLRDTGLTKLNEDIAVPRGRLEDLFAFAGKLQRQHGFPVACFGHAGDGNIHVNLMVDLAEPGIRRRSRHALDALFRQVVAWGGVITGEHGVGLAKKPWWPMAVPHEVRKLHRTIRRALDPRGILNPGKFV